MLYRALGCIALVVAAWVVDDLVVVALVATVLRHVPANT